MGKRKWEPKVTFVNQPNIPKMMDIMAELLSKQYGCEITIKATLKEEYKNKEVENNAEQQTFDVGKEAHLNPAV